LAASHCISVLLQTQLYVGELEGTAVGASLGPAVGTDVGALLGAVGIAVGHATVTRSSRMSPCKRRASSV
jgi:hypothetical protein